MTARPYTGRAAPGLFFFPMPQPRERGPYSAIIDRPPLPPLPGGNRIIFWTIVNVEVWDITRPMPRLLLMPPQGQVRFPDVGNWAWHEYGNLSLIHI